MQVSTNQRIAVQAGPGIKQESISKVTNAKRAGKMTEVVEPSNCQALNSLKMDQKTKYKN
jgi:hypothetical protein